MQAEVLKQGETLLYDIGYTAIVAGAAVLIGLIVHEHEEAPAAAPPAGQPKEPEDGL